MRRVLPLSLMLLLFSALSYGQWSGILSSVRGIDWSQAGLPATLPDGETTPDPWTPPTNRPICATITPANVADINTAITNCTPPGVVVINPGTYNFSGTINMKNYVTLRGSGASNTKLIGVAFNWGPYGQGSIGGSTLLTADPAKGGTSVNVASTSGLTTGRMAFLQQCMDGMSAASASFVSNNSITCSGSVSDPGGPWICGGYSQCDRSGSRSELNPSYQTQVFWIPTGGVSGNTVSFNSPIESPLWHTARTAALAWMSGPGIVGAGVEGFTLQMSIDHLIEGTYASWIKGNRIIHTDTDAMIGAYNSHTLFTNNYVVANLPSSTLSTLGLCGWELDHTSAWSDLLMLNNIWIGSYIEDNCGTSGFVLAYNYMAGVQLSGTTYSGEFAHNPGGQVYYLREGNVGAISQDDDTWTTHNFSTWFRNWARGYDEIVNDANPNPLQMGCFTRFDNEVGNVLGDPQNGSSYADSTGNCVLNLDSTHLSQATQLIWGNWVDCTGDAHCQVSGGSFDQNPTSASLSTWPNSQPYANIASPSTTLPASFFMTNMTAHPSGGTGLGWWKTCSSWNTFPTNCASYNTPPMPPIGPDVTGGPKMSGHVYNIPAYIGYNNLPTDSNYANGIRQFDERVYQADSGRTGGTLAPPTGLAAVVQ